MSKTCLTVNACISTLLLDSMYLTRAQLQIAASQRHEDVRVNMFRIVGFKDKI